MFIINLYNRPLQH